MSAVVPSVNPVHPSGLSVDVSPSVKAVWSYRLVLTVITLTQRIDDHQRSATARVLMISLTQAIWCSGKPSLGSDG